MQKQSIKNVKIFIPTFVYSMQAHTVETMSFQRWFNILMLNQRWIDIV